jgi:putative DNA primase/helicase
MTLPNYRKVNPDGIHPKLKAMKAWACWKSVSNPDKKKPDKVPYSYQINSLTGQEEVKLADCTRPETWMSFEDAERLRKSSKTFKGLQIALLPRTPEDDEDRLVGIDLDKALLEDGSIKTEYIGWIKKFNTLFELSPGDGVRGFCFGKFPTLGGKHNGNIEIYQERKWLTVTGHKIADSADEINNAQEAIDEFRAKYFKPYFEIDTSSLPKTNCKFTDEEIIGELENWPNAERRDTFKHYFYQGFVGNPSEDTFDLCCMIRYWVQEYEQIDSIVRKSALMRDKWDEMRGDITWGELTIRNALGCRTRADPIYMEHVAQPLPEKIDFDTLNISLPRYEVNKNGIFSVSADKDGELVKVPIASNPCVIVAKGYNTDQGGKTFYKLLIKASPTTENTVWRNVTGLMSKTGVMGLMEYDLKFQESDYSKITGYFSAYINAYENDLPVETIVSSSGWKNSYTQFVVGNRIVSKDGVSDIIQIDNGAVKMFGQEGSAEDWAKGVDDIMKFTPTRFKAYGAMGCVLLRMSDSENYIFDQYCGTTRLKSFTNRLVASMVGHPKKQQLSAKSTALGVDKIAAACNDLPVFLDETSENVAFVEELIYRFGNSNIRVKSNLANGLDMSESYSSGLLLTGEDSIITESSKGGAHSRRISETHGVPEDKDGNPIFVNVDIKNKVLKAMNKNYGNIITLFIQEILPIIDTIDGLVTKNYKKLPDTGIDAIKGRHKGYYAVMLTAGQILEKVFKRLGMTAADPLKIVTSYFEENVMCGVSEPDHIKMLRFAYDMYVSDKSHFGATAGSEWVENEKIELSEKYGWIDIKSGVTIINFRPSSLKAHLIKSLGSNKDGANRAETSVSNWVKLGISNGTHRVNKDTKKEELLKTIQIRTAFDDRQNVIQIPLNSFYKYLGIEDDSKVPHVDPPIDDLKADAGGENNSAYVPEEFTAPVVSVTNQSPPSSGGFSDVVSVTAELHENIIVHDGSSNLYNELMGDLGDDD